jgi:enterochelin esterase family protein
VHPLLQAVADQPDESGKLDDLRAALRAQEGPLRTPVGDHSIAVTFVWIGTAPAVSVQCGLADHGGLPVAMRRLTGTDVWIHEVAADDDALVSYRYVVDDPFATAGQLDDAGWQRVMILAQTRSFADPFNPHRIAPLAVLFGMPVDESQFESVLALPEAPAHHWFAPHDAPAGTVQQFEFASTSMGDRRTISVYLPAAASTAPLPVVVLLDGSSFISIGELPRALDAAISEGAIRPCAVAFVHEAHGSSGLADRTVELSCNPAHARMLATELVPELRTRFPLSAAPIDLVLGGASLGGLASMYTALEHAPTIGNVLSVSGSFWYGTERDGRSEWLTRRLDAAPLQPIRIYQQIGRLEDHPLSLSPDVNHLEANRHFREVAAAKGHVLHYDETATAHDIAAFRVATMHGLAHLLPGAPE